MDTHERTIAVYLGALLLDGIIPADLKVIEETMHSLSRAADHVTMARGMQENLKRMAQRETPARWPDNKPVYSENELRSVHAAVADMLTKDPAAPIAEILYVAFFMARNFTPAPLSPVEYKDYEDAAQRLVKAGLRSLHISPYVAYWRAISAKEGWQFTLEALTHPDRIEAFRNQLAKERAFFGKGKIKPMPQTPRPPSPRKTASQHRLSDLAKTKLERPNSARKPIDKPDTPNDAS